ncbi:hypothetical protein [Nocardia abscessus]|uniref:hypothetical protein n=1 Tax=Nocardia abscessus TaxID=120957 RepID=UPI000315F5B6|nr:hypothetical protein [Nocardia abscessus]MCC3333593.1 hypothetical protein [Nocardia abscessus]
MPTARSKALTNGKDQKPKRVKDPYVTEINGVKVELPSLTFLTYRETFELAGLSEAEYMNELWRRHLSEEAYEAVMDADPDVVDDMILAWRAHSGVSLGESKAS